MSHGILQLAVSGVVPLQLEYRRAGVPLGEREPVEAASSDGYLDQTLDDEFTCLLELI